MTAIVVVGSQWGDEGKGKITDYFGKDADMIARYQGGDNAGHSIEFNHKKFSLRLVPSGIFNPNKPSVIGNGVVINPETLLNELDGLKAEGVPVDHLQISNRAHVLLPYHIKLDIAQEAHKAKKIGTTKNGIGPAYMDKAERIGIRMADLLDRDIFHEKLADNLAAKNELFVKLYDEDPMDLESMFEQWYAYGQRLKPYVTDTSVSINEAIDQNQRVLFEGAQGVMLDLDHGTYPFVTSSNPVAGGATAGAGVGPSKIDHVIGTAKAYTSRVGEGSFPTEIEGPIADTIREVAHEYGVNTHRPRRIGWFDSVVLRHAARVSGFTELSLNCLDVLSGFDEIKVAVAYEINGKRVDYYPASLSEIKLAKPIYETLPGWTQDLSQIKDVNDLPDNAKNYLNRLEALVGVPFATISVGPDRDQTLPVKNIW